MTMQEISHNSESLLYLIIAQLLFLMCQTVTQGRKRAIYFLFRSLIIQPGQVVIFSIR
jgi:hypothetical protein